MADGRELLERWQDQNLAWHFEGNITNLSRLVEAIGYHDGCGFSSVENFLSDNPGAQGAIVGWIEEWLDRVPEWGEALRSEVGEDPDEDEQGEEA